MAIAILSWIFAIPLLGFLTGARTMMPMAVLCWFAYLHHLPLRHGWGFWAANLISAIVFTVLAFGEVIGDKLPKTPNRTAAIPLIGRISFGGMVGALCATGLHGAILEGIFLGVTGALAGTFLTYQARRWLTKSLGWPDLPIALAEDAIVLGGSILAMGIITG